MGKKGDMMDGILWSASIAQNKNEYPVISDYPETLQTILKEFIRVWQLPEQAIPSKKQYSQYKEWVLELTNLESLCSKNIAKIMDLSLERYNSSGMNFVISRPRAIKNLIIDAVAKYKRDVESKQQELKTKTNGIETKESTVSSDRISSLRNSLKED